MGLVRTKIYSLRRSNFHAPATSSWDANPGLREARLNNVAQGRFAKPEEIAAVCTFLTSPASSYLTGETIFASGDVMSLLPTGYGDFLHRTSGGE